MLQIRIGMLSIRNCNPAQVGITSGPHLCARHLESGIFQIPIPSRRSTTRPAVGFVPVTWNHAAVAAACSSLYVFLYIFQDNKLLFIQHDLH